MSEGFHQGRGGWFGIGSDIGEGHGGLVRPFDVRFRKHGDQRGQGLGVPRDLPQGPRGFDAEHKVFVLQRLLQRGDGGLGLRPDPSQSPRCQPTEVRQDGVVHVLRGQIHLADDGRHGVPRRRADAAQGVDHVLAGLDRGRLQGLEQHRYGSCRRGSDLAQGVRRAAAPFLGCVGVLLQMFGQQMGPLGRRSPGVRPLGLRRARGRHSGDEAAEHRKEPDRPTTEGPPPLHGWGSFLSLRVRIFAAA